VLLQVWLVVASSVVALGGVVWLTASAIALTAFGAPGTTVDVHSWAFVLVLWSYPIWGIAPVILAWMLRCRGLHIQLALSLVPFAIAVSAGLAFWR